MKNIMPQHYDEYVLKPGTVLQGRYRIEGVIGEGGFGITYEAVNEKIDMTVAIKELFCRGYIRRNVAETNEIQIAYASKKEIFEVAKKRFLHEARTLSGLNNEDGIVRILDYFEENGTAYIVMDYLRGITLYRYLQEHGPMEWTKMLEKITPLMSTLERVHNRGIVHRDISTSNIIVLEDGTLCLIDFGATKDTLKKEEKTTTTVFSKQGYTPIEQYTHKGKVGAWSDVYALSAVCYECLTGVCPPDSVQRSIFDEYKTVKEQGKEIPDDLEFVLKKGLAVKAEDRYSNMSELQKAINNIAAGKKRSKKLISVALVALILFGVISTYFCLRYREELIFGFGETETFLLERDKDVSIDAFQEDFSRIEERIKILAGEEPYVWEQQGDSLRGVLPQKCLGKNDPREIIRDLIARPNKWTINGVEVESQYVANIGYTDADKSDLVINLTENTPKDIQNDLAELCEKGGAVLSVDSGYNNHLSLQGEMTSPLSYTWDTQEKWKDKNIRELFLHNLSNPELEVGFTIHTQIQADWEERAGNTSFGKKQCDIGDLGDNRCTLEYWEDYNDDLTEGDIVDFTSSLKEKLDIMNIPYAVGTEKNNHQRIVLCVNQKDYSEVLFFFLLKDYMALGIQDAWGQTLVDGYSLEGLKLNKAKDGSYLVSAKVAGDSRKKTEEAMSEIKKRNENTYFLTINNLRILEGKLPLGSDGTISFDSINLDDRKIDGDDKVLIDLLEYILQHREKLSVGYGLLSCQYSNGDEIVSTEAEEKNDNFQFANEKEDAIIKKIEELSEDYEVESNYNYESGEERLLICLPGEIYAETVSDTGSVLEQISDIMEKCEIDKGTPWADITIGIVSRYDKSQFAGKISFSHPYNREDYNHPYTISVLGYEEKESKWLNEIYNKMKSDSRFRGYEIDFTNYSDYYIY